jgi:hypothetical protein
VDTVTCPSRRAFPHDSRIRKKRYSSGSFQVYGKVERRDRQAGAGAVAENQVGWEFSDEPQAVPLGLQSGENAAEIGLSHFTGPWNVVDYYIIVISTPQSLSTRRIRRGFHVGNIVMSWIQVFRHGQHFRRVTTRAQDNQCLDWQYWHWHFWHCCCC